jgi:mannitol/fructose-specific phosphotransferase system IIA component
MAGAIRQKNSHGGKVKPAYVPSVLRRERERVTCINLVYP